jgi:predicted transcriptional regulator
MTLVIELPPELERRLKELADQRGQTPDEYARRVVEEKVAEAIVTDAEEQTVSERAPVREPNGEAMALLDQWLAEEPDAEDESWDEFEAALRGEPLEREERAS